MKLTINVSPTEWVSRMLQGIEGLEAHPGSEPDSLCVSVKAGHRTNFEVVSIPVLSQEKADELVRSWQDSARTGSRQNKLIATRYLSSATRELLRGNGISWIEERTGICRSRSVGRCQTRRSRTERVRDSRSTPRSVRSCSRDFAA